MVHSWLQVAALALAGFTHGASATCVEFDKALQQGVYAWGQVTPGAAVSLDGEPLDVLADGTVFVGFHRDAPTTAQLVVAGAQACRQTLHIASRDYDISRVDGVPSRTVTPSPEHRERIQRERALVVAAKARRLQRPDLALAFIAGLRWPVEGRISGVYGSQRVYNGVPRSPHYGVDVARPEGTAVYAPSAGVITLAEPDLFFSGGTVILDHGFGLSSSFLHLSKVLVETGQEVAQGELLGEIGATGRASGPHLDWRMSWRDRRIDPQLLAPPMPQP